MGDLPFKKEIFLRRIVREYKKYRRTVGKRDQQWTNQKQARMNRTNQKHALINLTNQKQAYRNFNNDKRDSNPYKVNQIKSIMDQQTKKCNDNNYPGYVLE